MTFEAQPESCSYRIYLCCCEINNYKQPYTQGKKKLELLSTLSLASPQLVWKEVFSAGHWEKEALGASLLCTRAK